MLVFQMAHIVHFLIIGIIFNFVTAVEEAEKISFTLSHLEDESLSNLPDFNYFQRRAFEKKAKEGSDGTSASPGGTASTPPTEPWCYEFTWPGTGGIQNLSLINLECSSGKTNPCFQPFVFGWENNMLSDKEPDPEALKEQCLESGCPVQPWKIASKKKCIKYSFRIAGGDTYQNITRFVGVAQEEVTNAGTGNKFRPAADGCYLDKKDGNFITEVCICTPKLGEDACNWANQVQFSISMLFIIAIIAIYH
ncbi:uncharacterized protein LOC136025266 [Artemia franciscana]